MIDQETAQELARALMREHTARQPQRTLAGLPPGDLDSAYAVQDALHELMAEAGAGRIVGWKIALTSKAMQEMCGVDRPLAGALFESVVFDSPATVSAGRFQHLGLECEVAVRLARDLPASGAPYDRAGVAGAVDACIPAFELIEDRDADYKRLDAASLVADNAWNGGVVVGAPVQAPASRWLDPAFAAARTRLAINDEPVGEGRVGDAMGHPFEALAWVANLLAGRGRGLEAGMIVMTGSSVTTKFPVAGDRARFTIDALGEVELALTA